MLDLCDAVIERDGLLTVVNGGLNAFPRLEFPATLQCELAVSIEIDVPVGGRHVDMQLSIESEDGHDIGLKPASFGGDLVPISEDGSTHDSVIMTQAISVKEMRLPRPGQYRISLHGDGELLSYIRFEMVEVELESSEDDVRQVEE